jgi:hypothetical protein
MGKMCAILKGANSSPITRISHVPRDAKPASAKVTTTDPQEIDQALQDIWGKITAGNISDAQAEMIGPKFISQFGEFFTRQARHKVGSIDVDKLKRGIAASVDNSPGLDGVLADDLRILSDQALQWLANMFTAIEQGAPWPQQTLAARTAWLDKTQDETPSLDPLDYRGLAILSKIYRLYFSIRLKDLGPWIKGWECEELYAGTNSPTGAEDAWYTTALEFEMARLQGEPITGGSADIWKCFDQIQRLLIYYLLDLGGFPLEILQAYRAFHENATYYNTIGAGLGGPHFKKCSIPQGCPISMMLVGFTFHPWVKLMRSLGTRPRALADDLTITAVGANHEARFKEGFVQTMQYLIALAARPAPNKCFTFSTEESTRFRLSMQYWQVVQTKIKVVSDARDLGGHLSTRAILAGQTLNQRMRRANLLACRLAYFPWDAEAKQRVIETLVIPTALYGCEACPAADSEVAKLTISIAKVIGPYSHGSSNMLSALVASSKRNFSLTYHILNRSMALLRRILVKHPAAMDLVQNILRAYLERGKPGTLDCNTMPHPKSYCPPPGNGSRAAWNDVRGTYGPMSLLLARVHECGAFLTEDLQVKGHPHFSFDVVLELHRASKDAIQKLWYNRQDGLPKNDGQAQQG